MRKTHFLALLVALMFCIVVSYGAACDGPAKGDGTERTHYDPKEVHGEYPPMLRFDGVVYTISTLEQSLLHSLEVVEIGDVEHYEPGGEPQQDASANRDWVGECVFADARYPGFLFIQQDGEYLVFRSLKSMWGNIALTVYPDDEAWDRDAADAEVLGLRFTSEVNALKALLQEVTEHAVATSEPMGFPRYVLNWEDGTGAKFRFTIDASGIFSATFMDNGNYRPEDGDRDVPQELMEIFSFEPEE